MSFTSLMSLLIIFEEVMFSYFKLVPEHLREIEKRKLVRKIETVLEKLNEI